MGLERVHRTATEESFRPVRLGPQDLRDVAAVFAGLDAAVPPIAPTLCSKFRVGGEYQTTDIEDVLGYADRDRLPSFHAAWGEKLHLSFYAGRGSTILSKMRPPSGEAEVRAVDDAAERLRQIVRARRVGLLGLLRQSGLLTLFGFPRRNPVRLRNRGSWPERHVGFVTLIGVAVAAVAVVVGVLTQRG